MNLRLAAAVCTAALAGCASYVNIPPDSNKDIAINAINAPPTPRLIGDALGYVLTINPPPSKPYAVRLPVEADPSTWGKVLAGREGAAAYAPDQADVPVYDVRSIRIRGRDAWVDIVVPETVDNRRLIELRLDGGFAGWTVTSVRHWPASVIEQRESSGQYAPGASDESVLRPLAPASPSDAPPSEQSDGTSEPQPAPQSDADQRTLQPLRPVKPDGR
ncbi:MAG: hypothetical protein IT430_18320 [Phycisphaerales bacterium]|nr:hypothetical protein [Phycisphaerales bacterium]